MNHDGMKESDKLEIPHEIIAVREELRAILFWVRIIGWAAIIIVALVTWPIVKAAHIGPLIATVAGFLAICIRLSPKKPEEISDAE